MPITLDPEIGTFLQAAFAAAGPPPQVPLGDVETRRKNVIAQFGPLINAQFPDIPSVPTKDFNTKSADGHEVLLRWYAKTGSNPGSAVVYIHSGGLILCDVAMFDGVVQSYVEASGVPFLSVEYRLAPESPYPKPLEDVYAGLTWLHEHASELGVDPNRIAVFGESAGGCLAASLAIHARDNNGPKIAKQVLVYPMLDDRVTEASEHIAPYLTWSGVDNETAWNAYLGDKRGGPDVPANASPARLTDFSNLPPAYIEVGELDLFRDETVDYANKLHKAGIGAELHLLPGAIHAYEWFVPKGKLGQAALKGRAGAVATL